MASNNRLSTPFYGEDGEASQTRGRSARRLQVDPENHTRRVLALRAREAGELMKSRQPSRRSLASEDGTFDGNWSSSSLEMKTPL